MRTELIERARAGDEGAFASLADASVDRLLRVAQGILGDAGLAEDATQQALLNMWRRLPSLRDLQRFEAWSYRLVVNACYSEVRRSRGWMPNALASLTTPPVAPDELAVVHDRDELERAFRELSVDHRAVVILHHYIGLSMADTATSLDIREGTARSRLYYAMQSLRATLRPATPSGETRPLDNEVPR